MNELEKYRKLYEQKDENDGYTDNYGNPIVPNFNFKNNILKMINNIDFSLINKYYLPKNKNMHL